MCNELAAPTAAPRRASATAENVASLPANRGSAAPGAGEGKEVDIEPPQVRCLNKPRAAYGPGHGYRDRANTTVITLADGAQSERHLAEDPRMVTTVRALATLEYPAAHFDDCNLPGLVGNRSDRRQWALRVRAERASRSSPCSRRYCRSFDQQLRGHQASDRVSCDTGGHPEPASKARPCDLRLQRARLATPHQQARTEPGGPTRLRISVTSGPFLSTDCERRRRHAATPQAPASRAANEATERSQG